LTACEILVREKIPHGRVCIGFTPDEEIGRGAAHFDISGFGADFAYTMDGGPEGELEYENFNAAEATLEIQGVAVHPGTAKNIMVNALTVACEINNLLPGCETPAHTENYEGFYYLRKLTGTAEKASMAYSLRDHDRGLLTARKRTLQHIVQIQNERYGAETIRLEIVDRYQNMAEIIKDHSHLIDSAKLAMAKVGIEPVVIPMRGGTDGATLSYNGLPCPNLGTGGYAYHGALEHITVEGMEKCSRLIVELVRHYASS
ncbi:MAG: peptidase T, partial [Bacillota bacterium]|nr:peptidase T [Bacillota bacterium]